MERKEGSEGGEPEPQENDMGLIAWTALNEIDRKRRDGGKEERDRPSLGRRREDGSEVRRQKGPLI